MGMDILFIVNDYVFTLANICYLSDIEPMMKN